MLSRLVCASQHVQRSTRSKRPSRSRMCLHVEYKEECSVGAHAGTFLRVHFQCCCMLVRPCSLGQTITLTTRR
jgi:hypothetical protein